jgi:hypothetical protein
MGITKDFKLEELSKVLPRPRRGQHRCPNCASRIPRGAGYVLARTCCHAQQRPSSHTDMRQRYVPCLGTDGAFPRAVLPSPRESGRKGAGHLLDVAQEALPLLRHHAMAVSEAQVNPAHARQSAGRAGRGSRCCGGWCSRRGWGRGKWRRVTSSSRTCGASPPPRPAVQRSCPSTRAGSTRAVVAVLPGTHHPHEAGLAG